MTRKKEKNPTGIQVFNHVAFGNLRMMTDDKGQPFFIGKDVATALGYNNTRDALRKHVDDEDKGTVAIRDTAYETRAIVINESGLYSLMLASKLPQAKVFKRWVTSEVLPRIRKTGGYIPTHDAEGRRLTDEEIVSMANKIVGKTLKEANRCTDGCLTAKELADTYGMRVNDFNHLLCDLNVQYWANGRYHLKRNFADIGLTEDRTFRAFSLEGKPKMKTYMTWTPKGVKYISDIFKNELQRV
jgi:prophage antirepressor-like protein